MAFARTARGSRKNAREPVQAGPAAADENLCVLADDLLHEVVVFQRLRRQPDLPALRLRLIVRVRTFQQQALACGIESRIVLRARYALCTLLDEIIASSEWARGAWSRHSLLMTFHQEAEGGEGFFAYLDEAQLKPVEHLALLELMYLCLALGLEGRYRIQREGRSILILKRARLYETLRLHRERYPRPSPKTATPGRRPWRALRWTLCGLLVLLIGVVVAGAYDLQVRSAQQWLGLSRLSPAAAGLPSVPAALPTLAERLAEDIRAGRLTLQEEAGAVRLLLGTTQLFAPGGSVIAPESRATLQRTATVLADWPGRIRIIGHSDDTPVGKGLVSNQQLSLRRARAVLFEMFGETADPGRVQALGRGASEPRVPNDSADNRARNRRVEIVLEPLRSPSPRQGALHPTLPSPDDCRHAFEIAEKPVAGAAAGGGTLSVDPVGPPSGPRLSIDGVAPLAHDWQQWLLLGPLYLGGLIFFWWARRRRKRREWLRAEAAQSALQELNPPGARERRLRERLEHWRLESQANASDPVFLLLGASGAGKRSLMGEKGRRAGVGDELPPDDLHPGRIGAFSVMAVSAALLTQADPACTGLWRCLLDELKRSRRHGLGVAGAVLVLNAVHLLRLAPAARDAQALILRARLEELAAQFGQGLPVQVIVTHGDRFPGFEPSLLALPAEARDLVLAFARGRNRQNLTGLAERLVSLFATVQDRLPERLQREAQTSARVQLYGFPRLWRQFGEVLQPYLQTAFFEQSRVAQVHLQSLRCSGHLRVEPGTRAASQRLVRCLQQGRRHGRWRGFLPQGAGGGRRLFALGAVALVILLAMLLGNGYWQQTRQLQWLTEQQVLLEQVPASAAGTSVTPTLIERLAHFRNLAYPPSGGGLLPGFWLSEYRRLLSQTRSLYQQALLDELLPRVVQSLQDSPLNEPHSERQERLRFYLMLGGQGRFDSAAFEDWLSARVQGDLGQSLVPEDREQLQVHVQALIPLLTTGPLLSVDPQWVEQMRRQLRSEPQPQRLYARLRAMLASADAEDFSVVAVSGSEGLLSLARRSGEPLNRGVPARFSPKGHEQLRVRLPLLVAEALKDEDWVMGEGLRLDALTLHNEVSALYAQDYIRHWENFFADLQLVGLDQPESLALRLERLSRADSALFGLLRASGRETRLEIPQVPQRLVDRARQQVSSLASGFSSEVAKALPATIATEEHPVNRHFAALQQLTEGSAAALEALREALAQAAVYLQAREQALAMGLPSPPVDALEQLKRQIDSLPPMLHPLFADIVSVGRQHLHQKTVATVGANLNLQLGPECSRLLAQRYPFDRQAREQLSLVDFNRLFAPAGLLQDFQRGHPDVTLLDGAVAAQFRRAEQIRRAFFPASSDVARVDFELSPVAMDENIAQVRLTLDELQLNYAHGPIRPSLFTWPTRALGSQLRMVVTLIDGRSLVRSAEGPWAWFRFMEQGRLVPAPSGEGYWLTLGFEEVEVVLQLRSASLDHPFGRKILSDFRCPST